MRLSTKTAKRIVLYGAVWTWTAALFISVKEPANEVAEPETEQFYAVETETETAEVVAELAALENLTLGTQSTVEETTAEETTTETETETETAVEIATEEETTTDFYFYDFLPMNYDLQYGIYEVGKRYELNYEFLLAWAMQESSGNENCLGDYRNGTYHAYGLYQIQPQWWEDLANERGLYDFKTNGVQNCEMAAIILTNDLNKTGGDLKQALSLFRHGKLESCVEQDGITYEQHIFNYMAWIENERKN